MVAVRGNREMNANTEHCRRLVAAVHIDRLFSAYEIEMTPSEAVIFAETAPNVGAATHSAFCDMITRINEAIPPINFGPDHAKTGKPHHTYRIGRERGYRLLKLEIFKGFFERGYDFMALIETIHLLGTAIGAEVAIEASNNSYSVVMRWPENWH